MKKKIVLAWAVLFFAAGIGGCGVSSGGTAVGEVPESIEGSEETGDDTVSKEEEIQGTVQKDVIETAQEDSVEAEKKGAAGSGQEDPAGTMQEAGKIDWQGMSWSDGYGVLLDHPGIIDEYGVFYGDFTYLKFYFGEENCIFDSYWLCDVDGNGVPELFLDSSAMGMIAVFTYSGQPVFLLDNDIYGVNVQTGEVIVHGHWHGAGGTWFHEWWAFEIGGEEAELSMQIDHWPSSEEGGREKPYDICLPKEGIDESTADGELYHELYAVHVEPCVPVEDYTAYDISDRSGLDRIQ